MYHCRIIIGLKATYPYNSTTKSLFQYMNSNILIPFKISVKNLAILYEQPKRFICSCVKNFSKEIYVDVHHWRVEACLYAHAQYFLGRYECGSTKRHILFLPRGSAKFKRYFYNIDLKNDILLIQRIYWHSDVNLCYE